MNTRFGILTTFEHRLGWIVIGKLEGVLEHSVDASRVFEIGDESSGGADLDSG